MWKFFVVDECRKHKTVNIYLLSFHVKNIVGRINYFHQKGWLEKSPILCQYKVFLQVYCMFFCCCCCCCYLCFISLTCTQVYKLVELVTLAKSNIRDDFFFFKLKCQWNLEALFVSNHVIYYISVTVLPVMKDLAAYENVRCQ